MEENYALDSSLEERVGKCPYSTVQSLISGKWAMLILYYLMEGPIRFNEFQRLMPKMTHATLSVQLKSLVGKGLVERKQYESIPPIVEYSLTEIGKGFQPVLEAIKTWGEEYIDERTLHKIWYHFLCCSTFSNVQYQTEFLHPCNCTCSYRLTKHMYHPVC